MYVKLDRVKRFVEKDRKLTSLRLLRKHSRFCCQSHDHLLRVRLRVEGRQDLHKQPHKIINGVKHMSAADFSNDLFGPGRAKDNRYATAPNGLSDRHTKMLE